jgi:hypothetical protein
VTGPGSSAAVAIGQAAVAMGLPNPMEVADEILQVEVDALQDSDCRQHRVHLLPEQCYDSAEVVSTKRGARNTKPD